ncbi:repeat domain-containing protein 83 homolog [Seminavis robusta]|uniref:Repeat domain-containing protein 83 homolog n=1 Tax=Seminavis robusta TaxID=568900 RepID=A0A9N8HEE9_9STRA|nr:repeat domain-containing protein 83 homolog [Seminavis robusta]|eukprot:Sro512_g157610.1 repeat domain-containing protein 83 homolog (373) ;mRNA; r:23778-25321
MKASRQDVSPSLPKVPIARLVGHDGPIQQVQFAANGKYCLTGGHDRTVRLWNPLRIDPAFPPPPALPPLPSGTATTPSSYTSMDSLARSLPIQSYANGHTHPISALALDSSSTTLVAGSNKTVVITDIVTQQVKRRFQGHTGRINAVAISHGCDTYLSASYDGTVRIWDGRSHNSYEPIMTLTEAKDSVTDIHVVQDDEMESSSHKKKRNNQNTTALIRTASVDGVVRTYDIRKGSLAADDCGSAITGMTPTYDGQCLALNCLDGAIRLMELESGELLNTYTGSHVAGQYGLQCAMTADDATLVTGSEDGTAVLYDIVRGTTVQTLQGHTRATCSIATHPQRECSSVVITASYDGTAVVWANHEGFMKWQDG